VGIARLRGVQGEESQLRLQTGLEGGVEETTYLPDTAFQVTRILLAGLTEQDPLEERDVGAVASTRGLSPYKGEEVGGAKREKGVSYLFLRS
jgi:hypothetical protein